MLMKHAKIILDRLPPNRYNISSHTSGTRLLSVYPKEVVIGNLDCVKRSGAVSEDVLRISLVYARPGTSLIQEKPNGKRIAE